VYRWDAEDYNNNSLEQYKWAQELISKLNLIGNENVLDIGCGDGKITHELAYKVSNGYVVGIDNSKEMIELAKKLFPPGKFKNLCFQLGAAEKLEFTEQFDVIFSNAALHWVKDHQPILDGVSRALKKNGKVLLQMGGKGNASNVISVLEKLILSDKWKEYFTDFSFPYGFHSDIDYKNWVLNCGLKLKRINLIPKDMVHKGREGFAGWIRTTWLPYTERVAPNLRNEFIEEVVNNYIQKNPIDNQGLIHIKMIRLEVEAYK